MFVNSKFFKPVQILAGEAGGLFYKTLRIHNLRQMDKLHTKLVSFPKPGKVSYNDEDTSLLH